MAESREGFVKERFLDDVEAFLRKPQPFEKKQIFFREMDATIEAYIEIADNLSRQSRQFSSRARELTMLKKLIEGETQIVTEENE